VLLWRTNSLIARLFVSILFDVFFFVLYCSAVTHTLRVALGLHAAVDNELQREWERCDGSEVAVANVLIDGVAYDVRPRTVVTCDPNVKVAPLAISFSDVLLLRNRSTGGALSRVPFFCLPR
jgi:hypothetical protein